MSNSFITTGPKQYMGTDAGGQDNIKVFGRGTVNK